VHEFLEALIRRRFATAYKTAHRGAFVYHLHAKRLYRAIGEADNRHRRPVTLARAIERLILLDAVLEDPGTSWLGTERREGRALHGRDVAAVRRAAAAGVRDTAWPGAPVLPGQAADRAVG